MAINSIIIEGSLTDKPTLRLTSQEKPITCFTIESLRPSQNSYKEYDYFDIELRNKLAERAVEQLDRGRTIRVVGRLRQDRWADKDLVNYAQVKIVGEHFEYLQKQASA